jgi:hypothetical protein
MKRLGLLLVRAYFGSPVPLARLAGAGRGHCPPSITDGRAMLADRRHLQMSVCRAKRAVAAAKGAGAPIGDLESLTRRLRSSTNAVDPSLRIASWPEDAATLAVVAATIQEAAATALTGTIRPTTTALLDDGHRELVAISSSFGQPEDDRVPLGHATTGTPVNVR